MDGAVEVDDLPAADLEVIEYGLEEPCGVGVVEGGVVVGEPFADISESGGTEKSIGDGVEENVCIAMPIEPEAGIGDMDTAEDERSVGDGAVCIVTFADAEAVWDQHTGVFPVVQPAK